MCVTSEKYYCQVKVKITEEKTQAHWNKVPVDIFAN